jgi:hypothetical protein
MRPSSRLTVFALVGLATLFSGGVALLVWRAWRRQGNLASAVEPAAAKAQRPAGRRVRAVRRAAVLATAVLAAYLVAGGAALAYYTVSGGGSGNAAPGALPGSAPAAPTAQVSGSAVSLSWSQTSVATGPSSSAVLGSLTGGGYQLVRYPAAGGTGAPASGGCSGVVGGSTATVGCTSAGVPDGRWQYTYQPVVGQHWTGAESAKSAAVLVDTTAPAGLTASLSPAANAAGWNSSAVTPTLSASDPSAPDGSAGSGMSRIDWVESGATTASGTITGASGSLPAITAQGTTTITYTATDAAGNTSGQATKTVRLDTTAPGESASLSPLPNAAGWNSSSVTVGLSATDGLSGVTSIGWSESGAVTGSGTITGASGNLPAITGEGTTTITYTAADAAGNTTTQTQTVKLDTTAPANALSLSAASGAYLSGTTLYYRGNASGSFTLSDAVTDAGSGPASAGFPAIGTTGWTHSAQTVSTPAGGPYASSFSWTANPSNPAAYTVTGADAAGNVRATAITFTSDTAAPSGGSVSYPNGVVLSSGVTLTLADGSDSGSGVNTGAEQLQRASATYDGTSCGTFGSFTTVATHPSLSYTDTGVSTKSCYKYQYVVSDNVGNSATYTSTNVVKIGQGVLSSASSADGGGTAGRMQAGDTITLTFSEPLTPSSVPGTVTVSIQRSGSSTLTINGLIQSAGISNTYLTGNNASASATGSVALSADHRTITITLGAVTGTGAAAGTGSVAVSPATSLTDASGNAVDGTTTATISRLF